MTDDTVTPIKRLLGVYVKIAKRSSKRDGQATISIAALAEAIGLSRSRLDNLRGTYRRGKGRALTAEEARNIATHASSIIGIPPLTVQRWLLGVATEQETISVERAIQVLAT